ncbi:putative disease resistance protein RGA3 [Macadamia integrifolia]|uniref:putative disease resistance protein RGA3 n=1 Tax=Macadamia integrifolia TaxID=60698 RepID=UPI001C4FE513|nr:putative disease resistance protein RGA3 [Macadamia integrifolia]
MAAESILVSGAQGILASLISVATQEIGRVSGFKGELKKKLETTLTTIQGVLQDAENQQVKRVAVKDWLSRLKSVAYDADDVLDEFNYEALRRKLEIKNRLMGKGSIINQGPMEVPKIPIYRSNQITAKMLFKFITGFAEYVGNYYCKCCRGIGNIIVEINYLL